MAGCVAVAAADHPGMCVMLYATAAIATAIAAITGT
jgi:hypothetical protein